MPAPTVTQIWSSAAAQDGYLIVKGKIQSSDPIKGVMSQTQVDITIFDTTTYRNEMSVARIGRPWQIVNQSVIASPAETDLIFGPYGPNPTALYEALGAAVITQIQDEISAKDDPFMATPPFSTPKMLSLFLFWSGNAGTGNVLAQCRVDEFTEFSIVPSQSIF